MKAKRVSVVLLMAVTTIVVFSVISNQGATANPYPLSPPTSAPTPTPGKPVMNQEPTSILLPQPLLTEEQALEHLLRIDKGDWEQPWSPASLRSEPGRITLQAFPNITAESADAERFEQFGPEVEADAGAVWRITIRGTVHLRMLGMGVDPNARYDGVTYVISQRTGNLLAIISGKPIASTVSVTPPSAAPSNTPPAYP